MVEPSPRRLTLHVGQTKAGSTSLQNWLDGQRAVLRGRGVLFPASVMVRQNASDPERTPGHLRLLHALAGHPAGEGLLAAFEAELAENPSARVILSIENLFSDRPDADLDRLEAYFRGWQVEILAVLRPQQDWLRSRHVEETMSGFRCATAALPALAQAAWAAGTLDYRGRLQHLAARLGASRVRALRFDDAAGGPLVPRLLAALELPSDPGGQAARLHANRRERDPELVEAKRRLNGLIRDLTVPERLRIEHELRRLAREAAPEGAPGPAAGEVPATGLDPVQLAALQAGNDALLAEGILDQPLPPGRPDPSAAAAGDLGPHPFQPGPTASPRTGTLLRAGLELAARIAWQSPQRERLAGTLPGLTLAQIEALAAALARHPVSLHLQAPASAALAATADRALAILLCPAPAPWKVLARLDALETAAPLVALALPEAEAPDLPALLQAHHLPPPGLLVVGADCPAGLATAALDQLQPQEVFLWPAPARTRPDADLFAALCAGAWSGSTVGEALLARRRDLSVAAGRDGQDTGGQDTGGQDTGGQDTGGQDTGRQATGGQDGAGEYGRGQAPHEPRRQPQQEQAG